MIRNWQSRDRQDEGEHKNFVNNVQKWIQQGYTSPDLCFVWVEDTTIKGGIVYAADDPETANILDFSVSQDYFSFADEFLNQTQKKIAARTVCYHLYNDSEQYNDYKICFLKAGFSVKQDKLSYRFTAKSFENRAYRIEFRSFADVEEKEFIDAVVSVTQNTLDRIDAISVAEHGQIKAAEILIRDLKGIDFQPDIWMLAYADGKLIGLVIPSCFGDSYGGINYIGVVPKERGKGYVDNLLHKATQLLINHGVNTIIADIDVLNFPMKAALERVGYHFSKEEVVLEKHDSRML